MATRPIGGSGVRSPKPTFPGPAPVRVGRSRATKPRASSIAADPDAHVEIMLYFAIASRLDRARLTVPARRTLHLRFNDLTDPEPVPRDADYASVIESDQPIVVQHARLNSRQAALALISTVAFAAD